MSAFDRNPRMFPVSAVLFSAVLASIAGSDINTASGQENPVTGSSFSSATSVYDDKRVTNAVLQHSTSEARPLEEIPRGWTAAHGKPSSRPDDVVSLQSADARRSTSVAKSRRPRPVSPSAPRAVFMVSAGRPAIPPVPEPVQEKAPPEDLEAVELAPVEPSLSSGQSAPERSIAEGSVPEQSSPDTVSEQQPKATSVLRPGATTSALPQGVSGRPVLSATERFKLALEEERRRVLAEQGADNEEPPVLPSLDGGVIDLAPVDLVPVEEMPSEQLPLEYDPTDVSEIPADDPEAELLDERARRFVRLKQQLMHLKSQLEEPAANDVPEPLPLSAQDEHRDPQLSQVAPEHSSELEGNSEGLLPPVDGQDSRDVGHNETESPASASPAPDHVEHEPSIDRHADLSEGEPSVHEDSPHATDTHKDSGATDSGGSRHSVTEGALKAASEHAVVHGPIDRLGLANNLYAVGEYQLAMKMYEQTEMSELTAQQQVWTEYQIANCLRRMGRNGEASNRYRRIAEQPEAGWLSEQSRWWVDVLEQIRQLQSSLEEDIGTPEQNPQSPFAGVSRDHKPAGRSTDQSSAAQSGSKAGQNRRSTGGNKGAVPGPPSSTFSGKSSSHPGRPARERITHFAPADKEPKHGEH